MGLNTFIIDPQLFQFPRLALGGATVYGWKARRLAGEDFSEIVGWDCARTIPSFRGKAYDSEIFCATGQWISGDLAPRILRGIAEGIEQTGYKAMSVISGRYDYSDSIPYTLREHYQLIKLFRLCGILELAMIGNLDCYIFDYLYWNSRPMKTEAYYRYGGLASFGRVSKQERMEGLKNSIVQSAQMMNRIVR